MYNIKVKKGNWTSKRSNMVFEAVCFAVDEYGLSQELKVYPLKIVLTKFKGEYYGDSWMHETGYEIRLNSRYNDKRIVKSVFHEMTHVKQFAFDGLVMGSRVDEFKGKKYRRVDYWSAPWEVEARQMEKILLAKWKKDIDISSKY